MTGRPWPPVTARRLAAVMVLVALLGATGVAAWRSARPPSPSVASVAAGLLCPSCEGETVAESQSPMAAAMRDTIAEQLAAGRTPGQVRQWFVERYGAGVLADPSRRGGVGLLLWVVPGLVSLAAVALLIRARLPGTRRAAVALLIRARPPGTRRAARARPPGRARCPGTGRRPKRADRRGARPGRRAWDAAALGVVGLVAAVAVASPHRPAAGERTAPAEDSASTLVALGRSLEDTGRYAEAAEVYRDALRQRPDDGTRLRLALTLLRSDRPADAEKSAREVLDRAPGEPQAVLMLGLAQRAQGAPGAAATLRRFLTLAPHDPAAADVRRLLRHG